MSCEVEIGHFPTNRWLTSSRAVYLSIPRQRLPFELEGSDSHHLAMKPPPAFDSAEEAGEIAELY